MIPFYCNDAQQRAAGLAYKYKVEVQVVNDQKWYSNGLRFDTKAEAEAYGRDLFSRWTQTTAYRVALDAA